MRQKRTFGRWFIPALRLLRRGRGLRGTPFDPFGHTRVRRIERVLADEYLALIEDALDGLTWDTAELAVEIAELPELVRGYEQIKLASIERFRVRAEVLRSHLRDEDAATGRSGAWPAPARAREREAGQRAGLDR
jgi:indolepyruvate ferredoxin oxidoreductase